LRPKSSVGSRALPAHAGTVDNIVGVGDSLFYRVVWWRLWPAPATREPPGAALAPRETHFGLPVCSNPALSEEVETLGREIAGPGANAEIQELARRVAEAQIDLRRVRYARHQFLSDTLSNEHYDSYANMRMKVKLLRARLRPNPPDMSMETLKFATSTPQGSENLATILSEEAKKLLAMDRYERRALSRRKFAIRAFDAARARTATMGRVNVTRTR
jgi:hypothetical protein